MKKKVLLGIGILIGAVGVTQAAVIASVTNGAWISTNTWSGGVVPGSGDAANVNHDVSLSSSASVGGAVNVASAGGPGKLTLNSGAVLNSVSNTILAGGSRKGTIIINSGAVWTNAARINVVGGSSTSNGVGEGKMIVDGGRYVGSGGSASVLLFGNAVYSNVIASVVLTNGGSWVQGSSVSFAATNVGTSTETLDIYKDSSFEATFISATAVAALTYGVNVKGGDLILTVANELTALQNDAKIYFDAGTIKFTGVDTTNNYNTFTNTWNTWVDSGKITSTAGYTADQLKGALSFDGTDAVASIQPTGSGYLLTGSVSGGNGTVSPTGAVVAAGGSTNFLITASNYYRIASLTTNGTPVAGLEFSNSSTSVSFTWTNVMADGTLVATFTNQVANDPANTPYEWLAQYGLTNFDADANADQDGDGHKAWQEYIAGTVPTNAASVLKAAQAARNVITWTAQPGRTYSVDWSTNLLKGFSNLVNNATSPFTNTAPDEKVNHYQVRVRM